MIDSRQQLQCLWPPLFKQVKAGLQCLASFTISGSNEPAIRDHVMILGEDGERSTDCDTVARMHSHCSGTGSLCDAAPAASSSLQLLLDLQDPQQRNDALDIGLTYAFFFFFVTTLCIYP